MKRISLIDQVFKLSIIASTAIVSANTAGFETNILISTDEVYILGGSYIFNDNFTFGAGVAGVKDIKYSTAKDDFWGGYGTLELKKEVYAQTDIFIDATYVAGKTVNQNTSFNTAIGGIGFKYNDNSLLSPYIGVTTEKTAYAGISKQLKENWEIGLGVTRNFENDDSLAFLTFSYNFGSGKSSNIATSLKNSLEKEFKEKYDNLISGSAPNGGQI